jgi:formate hydrogenlyase subunit 4
MTTSNVFDGLLHVLLLLGLSPLLPGVINRTKAKMAGRSGPPLLQSYYDLAKLLRKGMVISKTTTWVFKAGPVVVWTTTLLAGLLVPLMHHPAPASFTGDMVVLVYLLALGRFFIAAAALDTGSPFEGMGAAREVSYASLAEPALFLGFVAMARLTGSFSLSGMFSGALPGGWSNAAAALVLVTASWAIVLLAENSRIPFDDPNTHLELTMIHEVMVLDHSGPALGLFEHAAAMKLFVLGALVMNVMLPISVGDPWLDWIVFVAGLLMVAVGIGLVESSMARLRLNNIPKLLVASCLLALFGVILLMV